MSLAASGGAMGGRPSVGASGSASLSDLSVVEHGARGDGKADDTAAFQATVDALTARGGGRMLVPPGVFRTGTIRFPYEPVILHVLGAGIGLTIWEMVAPDQPIIAIDPSQPPKRSLGARFESFSIRANAKGRADDPHVAIDCVGFSDVVFQNLRFLSNGRGSVGSWFHSSADPHLSYHQHFTDLICERNTGPGHVIRTANGGTSQTNSNLLFISNFWIYANSEMDIAFDLSNVTIYSIGSGLIEASGRVGIKLGNAGLAESIWLEGIAQNPIEFATGATNTASNNIIRNVYLSGFSGEIPIPRDCTNNLIVNVAGGKFIFKREDALGGNIVVNAGGSRVQPRLAPAPGARCTVHERQAYRSSGLGERWNLLYEMRLEVAGTHKLQIIPPAGSHLTAAHASALVQASGVPLNCAMGWPLGDVFVTVPDTGPVAVTLQIALE